MKKVLCVLCIMLCALSSMFAAGSAETKATSDRPVVRVYCGWAETQLPNWRGLVEEYNSNPDNPITIQLEFFGSSGYFDRLNAEFLAGDPPEVFQLTKTVFNEYSAAGRLYDLRDYLAETGLSETLNKGAQAWAGPLVNETGGVYGFPDFANTSCIFYNTKMFEEYGIEEPTDMESLREAARILNEHGKKAIVTGASDWCATDLLSKVQAQLCGTDILIDAYLGNAQYNDPILVEALTIVDNMVKENIIDPSSADYNDDEAIAELQEKKALNSLWNKLFRYSVIKMNKLEMDPSVKMGEDLLFIIDYIKCIKKEINCISDIVYRYTLSPQGAQATIKSKNAVRERIDQLYRFEPLYEKNGYKRDSIYAEQLRCIYTSLIESSNISPVLDIMYSDERNEKMLSTYRPQNKKFKLFAGLLRSHKKIFIYAAVTCFKTFKKLKGTSYQWS